MTKQEEIETQLTVPYIVHESALVRAERTIKHLVIALIISIFLIFLSHAAWLVFVSQYDFESYDLSTEGGGDANYIGQDGDIYNGTSQGTENSPQE